MNELVRESQRARDEWLMEQISSQATLAALAAERHAVRRDQLWPSHEPMPGYPEWASMDGLAETYHRPAGPACPTGP